MVFLAGQTGLDIDGKVVDGGMVAQFEQALTNLLVALEAAGGQPEQITSMTIYIVDMDDYLAHATEIGRVWRRLVGSEYPAMAGIGSLAALGRRRPGRGPRLRRPLRAGSTRCSSDATLLQRGDRRVATWRRGRLGELVVQVEEHVGRA